jgi:hypothetical protein
MDPLRLAEAQYLWAQARWDQGLDRVAAVDSARAALKIVAEQELRGDLREAIERWLATHAP